MNNYNITIRQSSKPAEHRRNYWDWSIWLEATPQVMAQIDFVEYILHPSFPNNVRKRRSKKNKFKLNSKGWGEFEIYIKVYFSNEDVPMVMSHYLELFIEGEIKKHRSVFISSTFSDIDKVRDLIDGLNKNDIEVHSQETIEVTSNIMDDTKAAIKNSDVFILYGIDENLTRNQEFELDFARDAGKEIIIQIDNKENLDLQFLKIEEAKEINILKTNNDIIKLI